MDENTSHIRRNTCERIKYYRRIKKLSQADMADKLWMSKRAYTRLEHGETALTLDKIHRIARIFEVSLDKLIGFNMEFKDSDILQEIKHLNEQISVNEKMMMEILEEIRKKL